MTASDFNDVWGDEPPTTTLHTTGVVSARVATNDTPSAVRGYTPSAANDTPSAATSTVAAPAAHDDLLRLLQDVHRDLRAAHDAAERRESMALVGALVVAAAVIHYLDKVHSRLQSLDMHSRG